MNRRHLLLVFVLVSLLVIVGPAVGQPQTLATSGDGQAAAWLTATGTTTRVSVASGGTQANNSSGGPFDAGPSISADGRYVAFASYASNLVPGDTNGSVIDVFVHDRETGETTCVSVASDGTQGNGGAQAPSISADGRYVAFWSGASNLVPGDTNGRYDVFVRDLATGETTRVSVASEGTDGNDNSWYPSISADGRYVVFESTASNLVPDDTNNEVDIFVHDRETGNTTRVSVASDGTQGSSGPYDPYYVRSSISADGRYVVFDSDASNLVPDDTNNEVDIFVHDRETGNTTRVSVASDGTEANSLSWDPSISADGRYVAFHSFASNLVPGDTNNAADIFVHHRETGQTSRVSVASDGTQGNDGSYTPSISADGRYVAFYSGASNLVPGDTNNVWDRDIFVHDRETGQTSRVSVASDGTEANGWSGSPSVSADGRYVAFVSDASNLVLGDTNDARDVLVHERGSSGTYSITGRITRADGYPLKDVQVDYGSGVVTTDVNGYFVISNLPADTYTLTPFHSDYEFQPLTRTVSVASDMIGQDFAGIACFAPGAGHTVEGYCSAGAPPLLNIPLHNVDVGASGIPYTVALLGNIDGRGPGRINSWFDHTYPNTAVNNDITLWSGEHKLSPTPGAYDRYRCPTGQYCYDGHEGIDFQRKPDLGLEVIAAVEGTVHCTTPAEASSSLCPASPLGNQVWINHGDGFVTIYGHLSQVLVSKGDVVNESQKIGVMGNTGCGGCGVHLHFEVRYDPAGDWPFDSHIDPFGCWNETMDCWMVQGQGDQYLWKYPLASIESYDTGGGRLQSPTGLSAVEVPAGSLSKPTMLQLLEMSPVEAALSFFRFASNGFRLTALQDSEATTFSAEELQFKSPVTVETTYTITGTRHLDLGQLSLYRLDADSDEWLVLPSTVDLVNQTVTGQTSYGGDFSLQAPLLCPADVDEPNDSYLSATPFNPAGNDGLFDIEDDEDWYIFNANGGQRYTLVTDNLAAGVDTFLEIFDSDGITVLAGDDNGGSGLASLIQWQAPEDGLYFIRVSIAGDGRTGCDAAYRLSGEGFAQILLPLVIH